MKRLTHLFFLLCSVGAVVCIAYLVLDPQRARRLQDEKPMLARSVAADSAGTADRPFPSVEDRERATSEIPPASNEILLDVYAFNLDSDQEDEQVLVMRRTDDPSGLLRLVVADYILASRSWVRAWEGSTAVTKIRTLQVVAKDVVGDHIPNIVAVGMNEKNEQVVSIFWRSSPPVETRSPLYYSKICEVAGDAVTIEETERPESYKLGQTNAETWPVTVYHSDPASDNYLDQIRETWEWNFSKKVYEQTQREHIPGAQIERRIVTEILDGNVETFKRYVEGIWYKATTDPRSPSAQFVVFDPRENTLSFYGQDVMESYLWEDSHSTRYGIFIGSRSSAVKTLRRLIDVELTGRDTISLRIFQDIRLKADVTEQWNGGYKKMNAELAEAFLKERPVKLGASPTAPLSGSYAGHDGSTLTFDSPRFTLAHGGELESGGFSVFTFDGVEILEMKFLVQTGIVGHRSSYRMERSGRKDGEAYIEILTLVPVRIAIDGLEFVEGSPLVYERRTAPR